MSFPTKNWQDAPSTSTPINSAALKDLESRVTNYASPALRTNVQSVGAIPGTDCSTAVLGAIAQYATEGIKSFALYFPAAGEAYRLALGTLGEEVLRKGISLIIGGDGKLATFLAPAHPEEPILTFVGPADGTNQGLCFRDFSFELIGNRRYDKPLVQVNFTRGFHVERVGYRSAGEANYTGTILSLESAYECSVDLSGLEGTHYILPENWTNEAIPVGQTEVQVSDTIRLTGTRTVMGAVFRNASQQWHNIDVGTGYKAQQSTYYNPATVYTTLAKEGKAGETTIEVASATGLTVNDFLVVGHEALGHHQDHVKVTAITGNVLTLAETTPLLFTHASGAEITQGGIGLTLGDSVVSATINTPHVEHYLAGITLGTTQNVQIINVYNTSGYVTARCGNDNGTTFIGGRMTGSSVANALQRVSADNPASGLGETMVLGMFKEPVGASHEASLLPSAATAYTAFFKGPKGANVMRRNIAASGEAGKDAAFQITRGNATQAQIQFYGHGFFNSVHMGDLGNVTGLTSAEIDTRYTELFGLSPSDSTALGTIVCPGESQSERVQLTRITGAGHEWTIFRVPQGLGRATWKPASVKPAVGLSSVFGAESETTPDSPALGIFPSFISYTTSGMGSEKIALKFKVTFSDSSTVTLEPAEISSNTTTNLGSSSMRSLLKDGVYITKIAVAAKTNAASTSAVVNVEYAGSNIL